MHSPREALKDHLYHLRSVCVVFLLIATGVAAWSFREGSKFGLLSVYAEPAAGTVVNVEKGQYTDTRVSYEFALPDDTAVTGRYLIEPSENVAYFVDEVVTVLYFPPYPQVFELSDRLPRMAISFKLLAGGTVAMAIFFACFVWLAVRVIRHQEESRYY